MARVTLFPRGTVLLSGAAALLASCGGGPPAGQVVASVEGEDVTLRDLASEAQARGIPPDAAAELRGPVLAGIVDRKLAVALARRERLDRSPDYLAGMRRTREELLATMLRRRVEGDLPPTSAAEIARYLRERRWMFAGRQALVIDLIEAAPAGLDLAAIAAAPSNDAVARDLARQRHAFRRGSIAVDSASLDRDEATRLAEAPLGHPLILSRNGTVRIAAVVRRDATPLAGAAATRAAAASLRTAAAADAVARLIGEERRDATIRYQPGFGPRTLASRVPPP